MTDDKLADEIEKKVGDLEGNFPWALVFHGTEWQQIIAALRRQPTDALKAAYFEGYEDALKDRQPSSDQLQARVAELEKDAARYRWIDENLIQWYPKGYNGCKYGRFDALWPNEESDLGKAVDAAIDAALKDRA